MSKEESVELVQKHQEKLQLTNIQFKKWAGKRYLILIGLKQIEEIKPFGIDRSDYKNMDDWLLVERIENVKKKVKQLIKN